MQGTTKPAGPKWEVTATTLRCESIGEYVTLRVSREWTAKCAWCVKYTPDAVQNAVAIKKTIQEKIKKCVGPDCPVVTGYRDRLMAEEAAKR